MASIDWIGNAVATPQLTSATVASTWATSDTATVTINGKDLVVTVGTPVTVTDVAALIVSAFNSDTRIDSALGSSNVGGQSIPEFSELIASNVAGVITFTLRNTRDIAAGKPFTLTTAETTAGTGTFGSVTAVQAATGPHHWDNADNWSAGAVPANDDVTNFRDSSVDCLYGLPNASKEVTIVIHNSFTGRLGLPKVNRDNTSQSYYEYRQRYVRLDDAGGGTTATHTIGFGPGSGPQLVNIRQATLASVFEIEANRPDPGDGTKIVNVVCAAGATINCRRGSVDISDQDGVAASVTAINVAARKGQTSDVDIFSRANASTACAINMVGGRLYIDWAAWSSNGLTLVGGEVTVDTCGIVTAQVSEGTLFHIGAGVTIGTLTLNRGGVLDISRGSGTNVTITNANLHAGCRIANTGKRITHTNAVQTYGLLADVAANLDYGYNRTLQIAG